MTIPRAVDTEGRLRDPARRPSLAHAEPPILIGRLPITDAQSQGYAHSDLGHASQYQQPAMNLSEIPRRPDGPRPVSKLTRTPSFPPEIAHSGTSRRVAGAPRSPRDSTCPPPQQALQEAGLTAHHKISTGGVTAHPISFRATMPEKMTTSLNPRWPID